MDLRIRNVALLFLALVLAAGLASAQPKVTVNKIENNGSVTKTEVNFNDAANGPVAKAPTAGPNGTYKYWDVLGTGGTSTNYFSTPPYITAPPNPQIATGPDDILTIVNRTIARYPNPNAAGNQGATNPYNYPPTEYAWLDTWLGIDGLNRLCPSGSSNNSMCVIDNASIRYDQMQGRFVVLFTVTDVPAHRSNWVLIVSKFSQFTKCPSPPTGVCPASSPLFTPPVIAPIVGGTSTGGLNAANWVAYFIPINLAYTTAPARLGAGIVGKNNSVPTGGQTVTNFVTVNYCTNGGPALPLTTGVGGTLRSCTNYFPTGARFGLDNDNIILTAPVLDQMGNTVPGGEGTLPPFSSTPAVSMGPYVGTRVTAISKIIVYNGTNFSLNQPPACDTNSPVDCNAVNLSDNVVTGTLTTLQANPNCRLDNPALGTCAPINQVGVDTPNPIPAFFWEPDNLRGRALASFNAQVAPITGAATCTGLCLAGVITPIDYLLGRPVETATGGIAVSSVGLLQPIVFSCPGVAIFPSVASVPYCGTSSGGQVADQPVLGPLKQIASLAITTNANPVGQGLSAQSLTANDGTSTVNKRLFVGDSRPLQVIFREGLLYEARTIRLFDLLGQALGSSTVMYDIFRTCAGAAPNPTCGGYSADGTALGNPFLALETEWFNGQNVPDPFTGSPNGDIPGFGFYAPMYDTPADVITSGPVSPINLFPWLEKLFVGMTTGGTANLAATFSKNFPSLWDFRPGDDAYDTVQPYIDPYTGFITTTVPCPGDVVVTGTVTPGSANVTVSDTTGLGVGMFVRSMTLSPANQVGVNGLGTAPANWTIVSITGNVVRLSANVPSFATGSTATSAGVQITFSRTPGTVNGTTNATIGLVNGTNQIGMSLPAGVGVGWTVTGRNINATSALFGGVNGLGTTVTCSNATLNQCAGITGSPLLVVSSLTNLGAGMTVGTTAVATITAAVTAGSTTIAVPTATTTGGAIFPGDVVTGPAGTLPANTTVVTGNGTGTTVVLNNAPLVTNASVALTFTRNNITPANTYIISTGVAGQEQQVRLSANLLAEVPVGRTIVFSSNALVPAGTVITNSGNSLAPLPTGANAINVIFTNNNFTLPANIISTCPANPELLCTGNIPLAFGAPAGAGTTNCPMIQWSQRGGASTDPNDGSLWLFGQFAKNRLASVPGPGQWGTSVANYALDFPAVDPYNNDNSFFGDVAPGSTYFTWIQIAKNLGIAQPSALGPCPTNPPGNPPVLQPPAPGTTPNPGNSTLQCPFFGPTAIISRAEMAYWVIRAQMDETMVSNFLCATGGDPTGTTTCPFVSGGITAYTFGDAKSGDITNPFISSSGVTSSMLARYIEVMARRGYAKGCGGTTQVTARFCPNDAVTRAEMSVFLIRAKMSNVFPTTLSGIALTGPYGDNFGLFQQTPSYFSDVTNNASDPFKDFYIFIQKMRELRITNGTSATAFSPGNNLTRQEIATFIVRAFFL